MEIEVPPESFETPTAIEPVPKTKTMIHLLKSTRILLKSKRSFPKESYDQIIVRLCNK